jgi:hypothetical protein
MILKTIEFNPTGATGNTFYNFTILLTANYQDLGFFDTYEQEVVYYGYYGQGANNQPIGELNLL